MAELWEVLKQFAAASQPAAGSLASIDFAALNQAIAELSREQQSIVASALALSWARNETDRSMFESHQTPFPDFNLSPTFAVAEQYQARVCLIKKPGKSGTGFLIASDIVLTNYHVVEDIQTLRGNDPTVRSVDILFDYAADYDEKSKQPSKYKLHDIQWLLASSKYTADEGRGIFKTPASPDCLDFAVLRLSGAPGKDLVPMLRGEKRERGWFKLDEVAKPPAEDTAVFIFHHPQETHAEPLQKLSFGKVLRTNSPARLRYDANSEHGSSGGLVVDQNFKIVGLHHAGPAGFNQGIPLVNIFEAVAGPPNHLFRNGEFLTYRPNWKCLAVFSPGAPDGIQQELDRLRSELIEPAIAAVDGCQVEFFNASQSAAFNSAFSPLRTAAVAIVVLGHEDDAVATAAAAFRVAQGRPLIILELKSMPAPLRTALVAASGGKIFWPEIHGANVAADDVRNLAQDIERSFRQGGWGPERLHPWTLLEFSREDESEMYLDANDDGAEVLLGQGRRAVDLLQRPGRTVGNEVEGRIIPSQQERFAAEQNALYGLLLGKKDRLERSDKDLLRAASVPMLFEDSGARRAFLPIMSRYAYDGISKHQAEIVHLDVTPWLNLAYDGHWQLTPPCGPDSLQQFDQFEQLKSFFPAGIVRISSGGQVMEANKAAELLLGKSSRELLNKHCSEIVAAITFLPEGVECRVQDWYDWQNRRSVPPLDVHTFRCGPYLVRGCYLGLRDPLTNQSSGCFWVFALVEANAQNDFVERLKSFSTRAWLWECYAASYDKVLLHCDYYRETQTRHIEAFGKSIKANPAFKLLDVGAGTGNVSVPLLREWPTLSVTAVDSSRAMLRVFQRKVKEFGLIPRCTIFEVAAENMDGTVQDGFDGASIMMAMFDMDDHEAVLQHVTQRLNPGGILVITEPMINLRVQVIISKAEEQLSADGRLEHLRNDWKIVTESGTALAKNIEARDKWKGAEGIENWLRAHNFRYEPPIRCYFDQCQTIIAYKN